MGQSHFIGQSRLLDFLFNILMIQNFRKDFQDEKLKEQNKNTHDSLVSMRKCAWCVRQRFCHKKGYKQTFAGVVWFYIFRFICWSLPSLHFNFSTRKENTPPFWHRLQRNWFLFSHIIITVNFIWLTFTQPKICTCPIINRTWIAIVLFSTSFGFFARKSFINVFYFFPFVLQHGSVFSRYLLWWSGKLNFIYVSSTFLSFVFFSLLWAFNKSNRFIADERSLSE